MKTCDIVELGLIRYAEASALQERLVAARKAGLIGDVLLLCEHPHVITLGRNGKRQHLLASEHVLQQKGVEFHATNRGGDIAYHGPGQIVGYPILDLGAIRRDVVWYVRMLEETMIRATVEFGIVAGREAGKTGVWVKAATEKKDLTQRTQRAQRREERSLDLPPSLPPPALAAGGVTEECEKLAAIGVHISRWVTSHGFAYNVSTDLRYFDLIVPCGIAGRKPVSLEKLLGRSVVRAEIAPRLVKHFGDVFGLEMRYTAREALLERLQEAEQPAAVPA